MVLSRLNSEMMLSPDRSEMGKNLARNTRMRPQNTVFWKERCKNLDFPHLKLIFH